ncbi:uroporphyrinogen-III synthase [uncultured Algimonas sp.]|uniref:uroporphyrinogen-III synthase n=1 Tax=uncultured Algimonas sp. TaxID=1547920 RepID=UPI0026226CBC|nr:uroporphyrinogen-III synthase [uncultured Algimonas sp.]
MGGSRLTIRVWITRTQPAAARSARVWAEAGFKPVVAPLLRVEPLGAVSDLPNRAPLIFTSAHGVRHSGLVGDERRVYAIGRATADEAAAQGFSDIVSANGNWTSLVHRVEKTREQIFHISGETVRGRIVETLRDRGLSAERRVVYRTRPVCNAPIDVASVQAVALYSPLASETLMALPETDLSHLTAHCLSANVAAPLSGMTVRIAKSPDESALIACSREPLP